ncbi:MAG: Fur family transcriptional regulator [bacterium]
MKTEPDSQPAAARRILETARVKPTRARLILLGLLLREHSPLLHEEIHTRLLETGINRVTLYRALQCFMEAGIVHRVEAGDRLWRFAVCHDIHHGHCHPHFTCRVCGRVECLSQCLMPMVESVAPGYQIEEQEIYLRGICAGCAT